MPQVKLRPPTNSELENLDPTDPSLTYNQLMQLELIYKARVNRARDPSQAMVDAWERCQLEIRRRAMYESWPIGPEEPPPWAPRPPQPIPFDPSYDPEPQPLSPEGKSLLWMNYVIKHRQGPIPPFPARVKKKEKPKSAKDGWLPWRHAGL